MGTVILQLILFLTILTALAVLLGEYMAKVFNGEKTILSFVLRPFEAFLYKLFKVDETAEMNAKNYIFAVIIFNLIGFFALFTLLFVQGMLPLNPEGFGALRWDTAFNTAVSFVTNTNWQAYGGENTMSYLTQMMGMSLQNFLSAAVGIAVLIAFIRGFSRKTAETIGNFWVDFTRAIVYVLLPLSILFSLIFVSQGMIQNLNPYVTATTIEGAQQVLPQGPVASQEAIKMLGTNGGGFFNANSAHPYENPNPVTDYMEILGLLMISAALPFTFGSLMKNRKLGWTIYSAMFTLYVLGLCAALWSEFHGSSILSNLGVQNGWSLEGKETRFGLLSSVVFSQSTTVISCGAVNNMHDSLMPLTGMVLMFNMMIGEVIFGGVGVGLIGMILYAILTMFLVGLMIGRTPEIFGKKLEPFEMKMVMFALLSPLVVQLIFGAIAAAGVGLSSLGNVGPHGLSEIIYAFASGAGNNGSAFAGLNANTPFYNVTIGIAMIVARLAIIVPTLLIAGSLASKRFVPDEAKFPVASPLFVVLLVGVVFIVGALTFFPVWTLGPILESTFLHSLIVF